MKYCLLLCGMLLSMSGFAQNIGEEVKLEISADNPNIISKTGYATYYARKFEGRKTTSGAKYRGKKMTAAHLSLPLGTVVTVTNLSNGKSVEVIVNDRGPHSRKYMIDVSEGAAKELGFYNKGQSKVEITYELPIVRS